MTKRRRMVIKGLMCHIYKDLLAENGTENAYVSF